MTAVSATPASASRGAPPAELSRSRPPIIETRPAVPAAAPTGDASAVWARVREIVAENMSVAAAVEPLTLVRLDAADATLVAPDADALAAAAARRNAIEAALARAAGRSVRVDIRVVEGAAAPPSSSRPASGTPAREEAMNNPLVRKAVELFDATVIDIRDDDGRESPTSIRTSDSAGS